MKTPLQEQSEALYALYQQGKAVEIEDTALAQEPETDESVYAASQWKLIWRKFKRNRAAIIGGTVIALFTWQRCLPIFSRLTYWRNAFTQYSYMRPQRVHFFKQRISLFCIWRQKRARSGHIAENVYD